jgi:hypothetical protein
LLVALKLLLVSNGFDESNALYNFFKIIK